MRSSLWIMLERLLDEWLPKDITGEILALIAAIVQDETAEARKRAAEATELMMRGEALRDQMKLHAILHGAYDHLVRKPDE